MKILDLPLKAKWYEMIESGEKKEEYRELKDYWITRFIVDRINDNTVMRCLIKNPDDLNRNYYILRAEYMHKTQFEILDMMLNSTAKFNHYDAIRFRYGYTKRTMLFKLDIISIGVGKPEWGAPKEKVFILKLGEKIE